jgi:hypothetical protein
LIGLSSVFDKKVGDFKKIGFESPCRMKAEESERLFLKKGGVLYGCVCCKEEWKSISAEY